LIASRRPAAAGIPRAVPGARHGRLILPAAPAARPRNGLRCVWWLRRYRRPRIVL